MAATGGGDYTLVVGAKGVDKTSSYIISMGAVGEGVGDEQAAQFRRVALKLYSLRPCLLLPPYYCIQAYVFATSTKGGGSSQVAKLVASDPVSECALTTCS